MTASASIIAGARILAADARNVWPQAVIKSIDQTLSNSSTLTNDQALYLPVTASTTYLTCCYLDYEGNVPVGSGGAIQYKWTVPSGATMRFTSIGMDNSGAAQSKATQQEATAYQIGTGGTGVLQAVLMAGTLVTGTAAGTLQLQYANIVPSGQTLIVHAQSFLALWQLSP